MMEGEKVFDNSNNRMAEPNAEMLKELLGSFTQSLFSVSNENVAARMNEVINEELEHIDVSRIVDSKVRERLVSDLTRSVLEKFEQLLEYQNLIETAAETARQKLSETVNQYVEKLVLPQTNIININGVLSENSVSGVFHEKFEDILRIVSLNEPLMLVGPAGSGKNVVVGQVAEALGLPMYYTNNANNEFKLTGFVDAGGNYQGRPFYRAFKEGGVFFLDEIDNSDPAALIVMNAALANGYMDFPHETVKRHPNFRMIAAANTWGRGSDLQYVGRSALDAATLDRFDTIFFDYDRKMEKMLYPNEQLLEYMWAFRDSVQKSRILHIVSTRGIAKAYLKYKNHLPIELILTSTVLKGLSEDDIDIILGNMGDMSDENEFLRATKALLGEQPPKEPAV